MDTSHGSPFDRGGADSYYGRAPKPHYWPKGTYVGESILKEHMTEKQIAEYWAGYDENEKSGAKKEW